MSYQRYIQSKDPLDVGNKRYIYAEEKPRGVPQTANGRYHDLYHTYRTKFHMNPEEANKAAMAKVQENMHYHLDDPDYANEIDVYGANGCDYHELFE